MNKILEEIRQERKRQDEKWGEQNHSPIEWVGILGEEYGEAQKEAVKGHFATVEGTDRLYRYKLLREELIQTIAVGVAMVESLDRNELNNG